MSSPELPVTSARPSALSPARNLMELQELSVSYRSSYGRVRAVDRVDLIVRAGEKLGLVGESGCGKTTLGRSLLRLVPPDAEISGRATFDGADLVTMDPEAIRRVRWARISMIFQNALSALNPVFRVGDQLMAPIRIHERTSKREAQRRVAYLLQLVRLPSAVGSLYPHQLSGGMRQRVVIALALACSPDLIIADEPTTSLDVVRQDEVLAAIEDLQARFGFALILITHDMAVVAETCDTVAVMYAGQIVEQGPKSAVLSTPRHPYTMGLLRSAPKGIRQTRLESIRGRPPSLVDPPNGCRFVERCPAARELCATTPPPLIQIGDQVARCHFAGELDPANLHFSALGPVS